MVESPSRCVCAKWQMLSDVSCVICLSGKPIGLDTQEIFAVSNLWVRVSVVVTIKERFSFDNESSNQVVPFNSNSLFFSGGIWVLVCIWRLSRV